ncbi:MAG: DUF2269 domain-containing protein [Pseudomonadota bacterium]
MEYVLVLRWLHILGATVLIGTGAGIAFFMLMSHRSGDPRLIAHTASTVVTADWIFTATAVLAQPITGVLLAMEVGWELTELWILASIGLYLFIGLCWLPVVRIQIRLRNLAEEAADRSEPLPPRYHTLSRIWLTLGFPAFASILTILWLMIARPTWS